MATTALAAKKKLGIDVLAGMRPTIIQALDEAELQDHRNYVDRCIQRAQEGSREEVIALGRSIADHIKADPRNRSANVSAQALEDVRAVYRTRFAPAPEVEAPVAAPGEVPLGTFTVEFPDGGYETIRLRRAEWADGKIAAQFLSGPDNGSDFTGFAFVDPSGRVNVWKRFRGLVGSRKETAVRIILRMGADEQMDAREGYAQRSGRCSCCGRELTVPASLHRGLGPVCARRLGVA